MIKEKLNSAYPFRGRFSDSVRTFIFISSFIAVFVFAFRSDTTFSSSSVTQKLFFSFLYGLTTFIGASLNTVFISLFVSQKAENNWNVWKEILLYLLHFFTISIFLYVLSSFIVEAYAEFSFLGILRSLSQTFMVGIIPVTMHVLFDQSKLYKQYYQKGLQLESERENRKIVEQEDLITVGEHEFPVSDILYVESNKNYLHFYKGENEPLIVRMTIKEFNEKLAKFPQFVRCHRAYIVNLDKVNKVDGNAQGLRLSIGGIDSVVPVSRSYISVVTDMLSLK